MRIEILGLDRWADGEPRPHHLDLVIRIDGRAFRACVLAPDGETFVSFVYDDEGRPERDRGLLCLGSMEDGILHAVLTAREMARRPELIEGTPTTPHAVY